MAAARILMILPIVTSIAATLAFSWMFSAVTTLQVLNR